MRAYAELCCFIMTALTVASASAQGPPNPQQAPVPDPAGHPPGMHCPPGTTWLAGACVTVQPMPPHPPAKESAQRKAPNPALEKILAAQRGETPEVDALVKGKDPNARDTVHQRTALAWTIVRDDWANFERLLAAGADVNAKDSEGGTPLLTAAELAMKHDTTPMAEALVAKGADVTVRPGGTGLTPLMHAANGNAPGVAQAILAKLDAKDVDARTADGTTALSIGAAVGASEIVGMLLAKGAQVDGRDARDKTPLIHAAGHTFPDTPATVKLLLDKGADVNARDKEGHTPLSAAKQHGPPEVVETLQKAGAR